MKVTRDLVILGALDGLSQLMISKKSFESRFKNVLWGEGTALRPLGETPIQ
jgi:hypothetical protein